MKTIVCYGDSNTWGFNAATTTRHPHDVRWTGVLSAELGAGYRVIEEGLNGRTTNLDDTIELNRNGLTYLAPCLESHAPIDAVTIMLGTNDLKSRFNRNPADAAQAANLLCEIARSMRVGPDGGTARVLMITSGGSRNGRPGRHLRGRDREIEGIRGTVCGVGRTHETGLSRCWRHRRQRPARWYSP